MSKTLGVFGVSNEIVESYIERKQVDGFFQTALELNKQIIVYGSSKQGKTALIKKHIPPDSMISIQCSPTTEVKDIYSSILRQNGITILTDSSETETSSEAITATVNSKIKIPVVADIGGDVSGMTKGEKTSAQESRTVEYNLSLAQDVAEALKSINFQKYIVLDNFHYLNEDVQKRFAFDLRIFQELDIRFIILGIWRERNRLDQFNGDLIDRVVDVAVEPWDSNDFKKVIDMGSSLLNVDFMDIQDHLIESSFDSIGVLQELCKESCMSSGIMETSSEIIKITDENLETAIKRKLEDYSGRHLRSFDTFAESSRKTRDGIVPLFIPYYFLRVLLDSDFTKIMDGLKRKDIHQEIVKIHHRPSEDIRPSDMSNFLYSITRYQINKNINPPLFDFDRSINTIKIIDSTLYFFLRNCNTDEVLESLALPSDEIKPQTDNDST
ncbi:MAG: hypothetical protein GQ533_08540 [Methanosarcinaceae archaeon]|nr:hypothetical protein [Methanosarcinaceae archaeon]